MNDAGLSALQHLSSEELLRPVLIQLIVILLAARVMAILVRRVGQPAVVGEVIAGLLLGPSVLGSLFPGFTAAIFHPTVGDLPPELSNALFDKIFRVLSELGLIFLLFLVGLESDFSHLRWHGKAAFLISVTGIVLPFGLGLAIAWCIWPLLEPHPTTGLPVPFLGFMLFLGLPLAITAIPVLGRIMLELNITRTQLGALTITAAAVDDALGWIVLAAIAAVVRSAFDPLQTLFMVLETVGFVAGMIWIVRPLLKRWVQSLRSDQPLTLGTNSLAVLFTVVFLCAIATNWIGIFAVFGAFLAGAALSAESDFRAAVAVRLRDLVTVLFLPIFFTYTGLRTNIGSLATVELWLLAGVILAAAVVGKLAGCGVAAWLGGLPRREAACIGAMMNTRGLMGLIAINLGHELKVIPPSVYCMLVLMALLTTCMTTPLLLLLMKGTELEPCIRASGFVKPTGR